MSHSFDKFADFFVSFTESRNIEFRAQYNGLRSLFQGCPIPESEVFDIELIGKLIDGMANGKAGRLDGLSIELIKNTHQLVVCILKGLFNLFLSCGHITCDFGASHTVPIPECDSRSHLLSYCKSLFQPVKLESMNFSNFNFLLQINLNELNELK